LGIDPTIEHITRENLEYTTTNSHPPYIPHSIYSVLCKSLFEPGSPIHVGTPGQAIEIAGSNELPNTGDDFVVSSYSWSEEVASSRTDRRAFLEQPNLLESGRIKEDDAAAILKDMSYPGSSLYNGD